MERQDAVRTPTGPLRDDLPAAGPGGLDRLRRVGEASFWLLVIGAMVVGAALLLARLALVVLPVLLAVVLATFLTPVVRRLKRFGWPDGLAAFAALLGGLLLVGAIGAALAPFVAMELDELDIGVTNTVEQVQAFLRDLPGPFSSQELRSGLDAVQQRLTSSVDAFAQRILSGALLALEVLTGLVLAVVVLFFLLKDGARIWGWLVGLAPPHHRSDVHRMGERAWDALAGFVRGQTIVALFDALLIGAALVVVGVPLAVPLAVLTFFGAYVPVVGAVVTGLLAVLVALAALGLVPALIVLAAILFVQQLEGNFFQPVIVGHAIHVHPVVTLLTLTAGGVLAGILGVMVAAPLTAMAAAVLGYLREPPPVHVDAPDDGG